MMPLEAAQQMAEQDFGFRCPFCGSPKASSVGVPSHKPDCPAPSLPKIVAALEAAEAVIRDIRGFIHDGQSIDAMGRSASRLESALRSR